MTIFLYLNSDLINLEFNEFHTLLFLSVIPSNTFCACISQYNIQRKIGSINLLQSEIFVGDYQQQDLVCLNFTSIGTPVGYRHPAPRQQMLTVSKQPILNILGHFHD